MEWISVRADLHGTNEYVSWPSRREWCVSWNLSWVNKCVSLNSWIEWISELTFTERMSVWASHHGVNEWVSWPLRSDWVCELHWVSEFVSWPSWSECELTFIYGLSVWVEWMFVRYGIYSGDEYVGWPSWWHEWLTFIAWMSEVVAQTASNSILVLQ